MNQIILSVKFLYIFLMAVFLVHRKFIIFVRPRIQIMGVSLSCVATNAVVALGESCVDKTIEVAKKKDFDGQSGPCDAKIPLKIC